MKEVIKLLEDILTDMRTTCRVSADVGESWDHALDNAFNSAIVKLNEHYVEYDYKQPRDFQADLQQWSKQFRSDVNTFCDRYKMPSHTKHRLMWLGNIHELDANGFRGEEWPYPHFIETVVQIVREERAVRDIGDVSLNALRLALTRYLGRD